METAIVASECIARQRIECAERFVHQHDLRSCSQRTCHADSLTLAARQFGRHARGEFPRQIHQIQQLERSRLDIPRIPAQQLRCHGDVLADAQMRKEPDALKHVPDAAAQGMGLDRGDIVSIHHDRAAVRFDQSIDCLERRRLARAGASHDDDELTAGDRETDVPDRRPVIEGLTDASQLNHRAHDAASAVSSQD